MENTELRIVKNETNLQTTEQPQTMEKTILSMLEKLALNPAVDADKMAKLLDIQLQVMDRQAKIECNQDMIQIHSLMPRVTPTGEIKNTAGKVVSRYMKYEDIDEVLRPILLQFGFSLMHTSQESNNRLTITTTLKHRSGHQESASISLPYDSPNALKNAVQCGVSTQSYGKRANVCSLFNIVMEGEDDDGVSSGIKTITYEQRDTIENALIQTNADRARFLQFMGVKNILDIQVCNYQKAISNLEAKARQQGIIT